VLDARVILAAVAVDLAVALATLTAGDDDPAGRRLRRRARCDTQRACKRRDEGHGSIHAATCAVRDYAREALTTRARGAVWGARRTGGC